MGKVEIVEAKPQHAFHLAPILRQADRDELAALDNQHPLISISNSIKASDMAWTALIDGQVMAIFGVAPVSILDSSGYIWLLGSHLVDKNSHTFLKNCPEYIKKMASRYQNMHNYVDARNEKSINWLTWLGFEIFEAVPYGQYGLPFHRFEMRS